MSQQSSQSPIKRATIMTNDIKDIVERLSDGNVELIGVGADHIRLAIIDAKKALTTLSEDNAAMKLEIVDYMENLTDSRKLVSSLQEEVLELRQALKNNPNDYTV